MRSCFVHWIQNHLKGTGIMNRFKNGNVLISFLIGALGAALMLFGFIGIRTNRMVKLRCSEKTSAQVLSITKASGSVDYIEAEFYADGARYTAIAKHHHPKNAGSERDFAVGTEVTVFYSPFDPEMSYIEAANQEDGGNVLFIGGIIFVFGVIMMEKALMKNRKKDQF